MILHQPAGICRRPIIAVQIMRQHSQHRHLLSPMMGRVRYPPHHHPGPRSRDIEKLRQALPPRFLFRAQLLQPFAAVFCIPFHEFQPRLLRRQRRLAHFDSQHRAEPQVFAHALMNHLFPYAAPARIARIRPER